MRANPNKFVGSLCGILTGDTPPNNLGAMADLIHWLKEDEFTKFLGIPFWMQGDENPFWEALYLKIKNRIASWSHQEHVSPHSRVQLADLIVYGIPRNWTQTILPPEWFDTNLITDAKKTHLGPHHRN
jgi:hypothetical protein